jgi:hypothetical protein
MNMIKNLGTDTNHSPDLGLWQTGDEMFGRSHDGESSPVCHVVFVHPMAVLQSFFNWISGRIVVARSTDLPNVADERVRKLVSLVDAHAHLVCF